MINKDFYLKYGLIYGVVAIIYLMITYIMGVKAMVSMYNSIGQFIIFFGLFVYIGFEARKAMGGYISFQDAFKSVWISYALGGFLFVLFNFVLNTVIDPELPGKLFDEGINTAISMMQKFGMEDAEVEKVYDQMTAAKDEVYESFTLQGFLLTYVYYLFGGAVGAAIVGLIVKKENPNPFEEIEA